MALRFELFALAWTHKYIRGLVVISQSVYTKHYLHEKGKDNIWSAMYDYNDMIGIATLDWLAKLGKINKVFNYNMRKELIAENIEGAKELEVNMDDSIERVNNRVWSENAWRQKFILNPLIVSFCHHLGLNPLELKKETMFSLAIFIRGFYDGAQQSWDKIKIKC